MKYPLYLLSFTFIVCVAIFSSCGDDEKPDALFATWALTSESATNCDDPLDNYSETYTCTANECIKATFTSNGTVTLEVTDSGSKVTFSGTFTRNGNQITLCFFGDCETMNFSISGTTLTFTYEDGFGCNVSETYTKQ